MSSGTTRYDSPLPFIILFLKFRFRIFTTLRATLFEVFIRPKIDFPEKIVDFLLVFFFGEKLVKMFCSWTI